MAKELSQFEMENEIILVKDREARMTLEEQKTLIDNNANNIEAISNFIYDISVDNNILKITRKEL